MQTSLHFKPQKQRKTKNKKQDKFPTKDTHTHTHKKEHFQFSTFILIFLKENNPFQNETSEDEKHKNTQNPQGKKM